MASAQTEWRWRLETKETDINKDIEELERPQCPSLLYLLFHKSGWMSRRQPSDDLIDARCRFTNNARLKGMQQHLLFLQFVLSGRRILCSARLCPGCGSDCGDAG